MCTLPQAEKKKHLEDELTVWDGKNRKRFLGNIRFIGGLFKLKMLSETIMHECVVRLLQSTSNEESLKCFAGLITTTGKDLDKPEAKVSGNVVQWIRCTSIVHSVVGGDYVHTYSQMQVFIQDFLLGEGGVICGTLSREVWK